MLKISFLLPTILVPITDNPRFYYRQSSFLLPTILVPITDNPHRFQNVNTDGKFVTLNPEAKIFVPSKEKTNDEH